MQWPLRSPVRSDDQPDTSTPRNPHRKMKPVQFSTLVEPASWPVEASSPSTIGRQPEDEDVAAHVRGEEREREQPHVAHAERLPQ